MNFTECLNGGLIKKDLDASKKIEESFTISKRFLEEAEGNFKMRYYEACELLAYNSSFHSARALLFSKGYRERSHVCLVLALKSLFEKDPEIMELLNTFDQLRLSRHNVQYGGSLVTEDKARIVVDFASRFYTLAAQRLKR